MTVRLYNTLTRSIQDFTPLNPKTVTMYVCGPTVYDHPHIGHARSAYMFDVLRRYLEYRYKQTDPNFKVTFVRNVTDVDDKIIHKANDAKSTAEAVAEQYLKSYHDVLATLGIEPPTHEPKATQHIDEMVNLISQLVLKGAAYETKSGDVYFAVRKFEPYGKLSNRTLDELQAGARVEPGEDKRDPLDFALWKAAKPGEPSWSSPWGKGRPGWHIECSAMSMKYLGDTFDIHGGGVDLVFPHHENEIAQAQAVDKPFAKYWIHNGLLTVNGEKMSKSLGNFVTVDHALAACGGEADALKIFFLGAHYRSPIDYSETNIKAAGGRFDGLYAFLKRADEWGKGTAQPDNPPQEITDLVDEFKRVMDEDLNTPLALAVLDKLANIGYRWMEDWLKSARLKEKMSPDESAPVKTEADDVKQETLKANFVLVADSIKELGQTVFGLSFQLTELTQPAELTPEQRSLLKEREEARRLKDFQKSDRIRQQLAVQNIIVEDTERGQLVRRRR